MSALVAPIKSVVGKLVVPVGTIYKDIAGLNESPAANGEEIPPPIAESSLSFTLPPDQEPELTVTSVTSDTL